MSFGCDLFSVGTLEDLDQLWFDYSLHLGWQWLGGNVAVTSRIVGLGAVAFDKRPSWTRVISQV